MKNLLYLNIRFKGENKWFENKLKQLEDENDNIKSYMDALEKVYKY